MLASWAAEPLLTARARAGTCWSPARAGSRRSWTSSSPRRASAPARAARRSSRSRRLSFGEPSRRSTSAPRRAARTARPRASRRRSSAGGRMALADLAAPGRRAGPRRRRGHAGPGPVFEILAGIARSSPEGAAMFPPGGRPPRRASASRCRELGDAIERLGADGAAPFYTGDIAAAIVALVGERGGLLTAEDLAAYEALPARAGARLLPWRAVLTNPPPSAGARSSPSRWACSTARRGPPRVADIVDAMAAAQEARTDAFVEGLAEPGFLERFLASRLGGTTHISVVDGEGRAASVTCTNGEGSGIVVPGTGRPRQQHHGRGGPQPAGLPHRPARPADAVDDGPHRRPARRRGGARRSAARDPTGSAPRCCRRSSASSTTGSTRARAVDAPRAHFEDGLVYAEPGVPLDELTRSRDRRLPQPQPVLRRRAGRGARQRHRRVSPAPVTRAAAARSPSA